MEFKGEIVQMYPDYATGKNMIVLSTCAEVFETAQPLLGKNIRAELKLWREKRSLNANNYFHTLKSQMAKVLHVSEVFMHNQLISRYGQHEYIDGKLVDFIVKDSIDIYELDSIHLQPTPHTKVMGNGEMYRVCFVMRGSHTYDTKEMSELIDGTVSECRELGIETMPPEELERLKAMWRP